MSTLLAGLGALLLLISLFLDWYGDPDSNAGRTGWTTFELLDVVLAALAISVLYEVTRGLSSARDWPAAPPISRLAGPVALVLVVVSIIDNPPLFVFVDPDFELGIWLALAGALLMTIGPLLTRVRVSLVTAPDEPRPTPPHDPDTETRPLP